MPGYVSVWGPDKPLGRLVEVTPPNSAFVIGSEISMLGEYYGEALTPPVIPR